MLPFNLRSIWAAIFLAAAILIISLPAIAARKRQPQEQTSQPPALVKFELSAVDAHGEPVRDLQESECQLSEDGKHQVINLFHYDGNDRAKATPSAPPEFSNRDGFAVHPTVVLLDLLSERLLTWGQAEGELLKALQGVHSAASLYVYILTNQGTFYAVHPLPKNEPELRAMNPSWTQEIGPRLDQIRRELAGFRPIDDQDPWFRAQLTLRSLGQFASSVSAIPGRINLIWVTQGVPSVAPGITSDQPVDLRPELQQMSETLARARVAVYTVAQSASGAGESMGYNWETLQLISGLTGGRAYSSDSIDTAITEAMADARGSYVVGYYPRREKDDNKHHKVRVTCTRKGVRLQTIDGYFAFPVPSSPAQLEQAALEVATDSPFDNSGIGMRAVASIVAGPSSKARFQIYIDSADLASPSQRGDLAVRLIAYSATNAVQRIITTPVQRSVLPGQAPQAARKEVQITQELAIDGTTQNVRIVVFDPGTNLTGSITIPVTEVKK